MNFDLLTNGGDVRTIRFPKLRALYRLAWVLNETIYYHLAMVAILIITIIAEDVLYWLLPKSLDLAIHIVLIVFASPTNAAAQIFLLIIAFDFVISLFHIEWDLLGYSIAFSNLLCVLSLLFGLPWILSPITGVHYYGTPTRDTMLHEAVKSISFLPRFIRYLRFLKLFLEFARVKVSSNTASIDSKNRLGTVYIDLATNRVVLLVENSSFSMFLFHFRPLHSTPHTHQTLFLSLGIGLASQSGFGDYSATLYSVQSLHKINLAMELDESALKSWAASVFFQHEKLVYLEVCSTPCPNRTLPATLYTTDQFKQLLQDHSKPTPQFLTLSEIQNRYRPFELLYVSTSTCYTDNYLMTPRPEGSDECESVSIFDIGDSMMTDHEFNLLRFATFLLLLSWTSLLFTKDATNLVINPIARMITTVNELALNPLSAVYMSRNHTEDNSKRAYETILLEKTLDKIGKLLFIGFGEAGADIIIKNLSREGNIDPMIPGRRIAGVFGFCDIRSFTTMTECLQENVLKFVNTVSGIVHENVASFGGAANKNIGDAFLVVWKLQVNPKMPSVKWKNEKTEIIATNALCSFIQSIIDIEKSNLNQLVNSPTQLYSFTSNPAVVKRLGEGYKIQLGYGLHVGWAIEGALGSHYKIDASYLSTHVQMSEQLQDLSPSYKVPIILSGEFVGLLPDEVATRCRHMDRLNFPGSKSPTEIYTFDITEIDLEGDLHVLKPAEERIDFLNNYTIDYLQNRIPEFFIERYEDFIRLYIRGEWKRALVVIDALEEDRQQFFIQYNLEDEFRPDGPATLIKDYLNSYNAIPPVDWLGSRPLD